MTSDQSGSAQESTSDGGDEGDGTDAAPRGGKARAVIREVLRLATLVVVLAMARSSLADHYQVPTGSMIPTVAIGDHVVVNKLAYALRIPFTDHRLVSFAGPKRGDVVVLDSPEDTSTLLKRVVAVPGDLVEVHSGVISINGKPFPVESHRGALTELIGSKLHALRLTHGGGMDYGPAALGRDEYLVMGDNRGESHDGRAFGLVKRESIFGRAVGVWLREGRPCWHSL